MSSEVCPFCGKPFKRLKAHLPHCKAREPPAPACHPKDPPDDDNMEPSLSKLTTAATPQKEMKKSKASVPLTSSSMVNATDSEMTSSSSSVSTKKKKQRLKDEIKQLTTRPSSSSISLSPSPPPPPLPPSSTLSKPKKQSLRALIEASRSAAVLSEPREGTASASASLDLLSVSSSDSDTLTSTTPRRTERQLTPQQDTKPKAISKKKKSQRQENASTASGRTSVEDNASGRTSVEDKASGRTSVEDWEVRIVGGVVTVVSPEDEGPKGPKNTAENRLFWASGGDDAGDVTTQSRITLQGVKASLGRSHTNTNSSILEQVLTADSRTKAPVSVDAVRSNPPSEQFSDTVSKAQKPLPASRPQGPEGRVAAISTSSSSSGSWQHGASSIPPPPGPAVPKLTLRERPNLSHNEVGPFSPPPVGQLAGRGAVPGAPPSSSSSLPPPRLLLAPPVTSRPGETLMTANPLLRVAKADVVVNRIGGVLAERRLAQVELREVPAWLALKTPSRPAEVVDMIHGGWRWYYRKYMDVRKGGVGGLAMLLAGYCALSYMWSYPHIKRDRWRKYH